MTKEHVIILPAEDFDKLVKDLESKKKPNKRIRAAALRYKRMKHNTKEDI